MSTKITALLISYNEEKNIERFLQEANYADEIIIVDSFSTDKTEEIALKNNKVKFVKRKFDNYTNQRNYALSLANNDWITFFDADESLSTNLQNEILSVVNQSVTKDAYFVYRQFYFKEKAIKFSGMQNDKAIRLFKKSKCKYDSSRFVHELVNCDGEIGFLKNKLNHFTLNNEEEYLNKLNRYSRLRAEELKLKNLSPTFFHYKLKPAYRFFNYFIMRFGFLDGKEGYVLSKLHAESVANRYKYLDEIYQEGHLKTSLNNEV